jgi:hypothetical protein
MSNAQSMDDPVDPRLAQKREAAQFIIRNGTTGMLVAFTPEIEARAIELIAGDREKFDQLVKEIATNGAIGASIGTVNENGTIGSRWGVCEEYKGTDPTKWSALEVNPWIKTLGEAIAEYVAEGEPPAGERQMELTLAAVLACRNMESSAIIYRVVNELPRVCIDCIAMAGSTQQWRIFFLSAGAGYQYSVFTAQCGQVISGMKPENINEFIRRAQIVAEEPGHVVTPEEVQRGRDGIRNLARWIQGTAGLNRGAIPVAIYYSRLRGIIPHEASTHRAPLVIVQPGPIGQGAD